MDIKNILSKLDTLTEGTMAGAEKHSTGPKFVGKWKGTDPASAAKNKLVGSGCGESVLKELEAELSKPKATVKRDLAEEFKSFKEGTAVVNAQDIVKLDVPLLIRLLEYAKEDAETDMDLHNVAEKLISMSTGGDVLSMDQYDSIIGAEQIDEYGGVGGYGAASQAPQGTSTTATDPKVQQQKLDAAQIKKSTQQLQPTLNAQGAAQKLNPVKFGDVMDKLDTSPNTQLSNQEQNQLSPMAVATSKILQNPQTASQMKQLITKADQIEKAKAEKVAQQQKQIGTNPTGTTATPTTPSAGTVK